LAALLVVLALPAAEAVHAQESDPILLYDENGTTCPRDAPVRREPRQRRRTCSGTSRTSRRPGSGYDPDATWLELYVRPGLTFETALGRRVGHSTAGSPPSAPTRGGTDAFDTGDTGRWTLEESVRRIPRVSPFRGRGRWTCPSARASLRLGTGMLISDGASDGFERGALKFGPRRAWEIDGDRRAGPPATSPGRCSISTRANAPRSMARTSLAASTRAMTIRAAGISA
jgi:hypothetical protein